MAESQALIERFRPTIDVLPPVLRHMGAPDGAGLVCWNVEDPQRWRWGDDPAPNERCELSHVYVSQFGDDSDKWRAIRLAAWALSLWDAIITPEPETPESDTLVFAVSLGAAIRELEEFGLIDEDGHTLSELAGEVHAIIAQRQIAWKQRSSKNKEAFQGLDGSIKKILDRWREEGKNNMGGIAAAKVTIGHYNKKIKKSHRGKQYSGTPQSLWEGFKKRNPDWYSEYRRARKKG